MTNQTISGTGSAMMGAGLVMIQNDLNTGLLLIGVGVVLQVLVAVLNKYNIPVSSNLG
jgi:uncharacterized membrane protein